MNAFAMLLYKKIKEQKLLITVAQKLNQGAIRIHGVADCGALFWAFFGQTKKYNHNKTMWGTKRKIYQYNTRYSP